MRAALPADQATPTLFELLGLGSPDESAWTRDALCVQTDPDAFHPERGEPFRAALAVCAGCPVQAKCLDWAVAHGERDGIWGGTTPQQRRPLIAAHRRGAVAALTDRIEAA